MSENIAVVGEKSVSKARLIDIVLIPLVALAVVSLLYMLLPSAREINQLLGTRSQQTGWLTTLFGFFYACGFLFWGTLSDNYGRNKVMIFGLLLLAVVSVFIGFSKDYWFLLVARCVQGFVASSYPPVILAWINERYEITIRRWLISLVSCAFLLAGTIGQLYGHWLIKTSLLSSMLPLAVVYLVGMLYFIMNPQKQKNSGTQNKKRMVSSLVQLPKILVIPKFLVVYFSSLFVLMSFIAQYYLLINGLDSALLAAIDVETSRKVATVGMLTCLVSGLIFARITPEKMLSLALLVMSVTLAIQFVMIRQGIHVSLLFMLTHYVFSCAVSLAIPSMITCVMRAASDSNRAAAVSVYTFVLFIGASLGSYLPQIIMADLLYPLIILMILISAMLVFIRQKRAVNNLSGKICHTK